MLAAEISKRKLGPQHIVAYHGSIVWILITIFRRHRSPQNTELPPSPQLVATIGRWFIP